MNTTTIYEGIAALVGFFTLLGYVVKISYKLGALTLKVDTMWAFLVNRGKLEAAHRGWGTILSPFEANEKGLSLVLPFLDLFLPIYIRGTAEGKSEEDIQLEFERQHADFLIRNVCLPNQMQLGACVVLMYEACKMKTKEQLNA